MTGPLVLVTNGRVFSRGPSIIGTDTCLQESINGGTAVATTPLTSNNAEPQKGIIVTAAPISGGGIEAFLEVQTPVSIQLE